AIKAANGLTPIITMPSTVSATDFWGTFFLSISALLGTVATLVMNISDLTRFSKSQKDQMIGQGIGMPLMFFVFSMMAIITTAGTVFAYGNAITNPVDVLMQFENPF